MFLLLLSLALWLSLSVGASSNVDLADDNIVIERVSTVVPFPRGLELVDGKMYVLARGRVRDAGGVTAEVNDQAGSIFVIDPEVSQSVDEPAVSEAVRSNGTLFAAPTEPPFRLWRRDSNPPESDRETDRPYCTLRYHAPSQNFFICGFSGIDLPEGAGRPSFSKNCNDVVLRYDCRTRKWQEVERHHLHAGGNYPHHDPQLNPPPHGWMNGPDNILVVSDNLYAAAKDNSMLVRYDLSALQANPDAGPPPSQVVFQDRLRLRAGGELQVLGHSMLAQRDGFLYIGFRTSSQIVRIRIDGRGLPMQPIVGEPVAQFDPFDPKTGKSANITDMCFDSRGRLYVVSANGGIVHRFAPDPRRVHDARSGALKPWLHLGQRIGKPKLKCENVFVDEQGRLFITSGDGYSYQAGADGTVYRLSVIN